ncbi:MAG: peroxiredoxin [Candidatus Thorarchaeota archaeon]|jgi:peroxiredoxin Q/BCP
MLEAGDEAPDFETEDDTGKRFKLSEYRGQKLVLYFYPKDFTPGCISEACSIRDSYQLFEGAGIPIFGISGGTAELHQKFRKKYNLPFNILMDEDLNIAKLFGTFSRLNIIGIGVKRVTFLIDEEGKIEGIFGSSAGIDKVRSKKHAEQIVGFWGLKL